MSYLIKMEIEERKQANIDSNFVMEINKELTCDVIDDLRETIKNFQEETEYMYSLDDIIDLTTECLAKNGYECSYRSPEYTISI